MSGGRTLRVLALGAHPDDVELYCGGTVSLLARAGHEVHLLDLTRGEMGSRGTPETRAAEASEAASILGVAGRSWLDLGDARLEVAPETRASLAGAYRRIRPDLVLAPWVEDRHPDHGAAGRLARAAAFDARLARLELGAPPFSPGLILHYPGHDYVAPTVVVEVTAAFEVKMAAIRAHRSQFPEEGLGGGPAPAGFRDYLWQIESRTRHYGSLIDRPYGEGFISWGPVALPDLAVLFPLPSTAQPGGEMAG